MSAPSQADQGDPPIAYLCSAYPLVSQTFVMREVLALRRLGVDVQTFTVRRSGPEDLLSDLDRDEAARTQHLLPTSGPRLLSALVALLRAPRGPAALAAAGREAWAMRRPGIRSAVWQLFYLVEAVLLWSRCSRLGIRHVHAHFANVASDVALLTAALGSAADPEHPWSWSWTMHGPTDFWMVHERKLAEKVQKASFVACISDFARSQLMAHTTPAEWQRLHVVHCGVDLAVYRREADPSPPASEQPPRLLTIGRLVPAKGQILIVDAVHALRARGLPVTAEILGEGPARPDIERRIDELGLQGVVTLPGAVAQDRVPERLRAATAFVLPSFSEGVPVVAMEAMALGTPVVTSRIAGTPELIDDGVSGLLTTPSRLDELVNALERLLTDEALRRRIADEAARMIAADFDVDGQAKRLAGLFPDREALATLHPVINADLHASAA